jgi:hypothetical protein
MYKGTTVKMVALCVGGVAVEAVEEKRFQPQ